MGECVKYEGVMCEGVRCEGVMGDDGAQLGP